jgi:hypothetical protein
MTVTALPTVARRALDALRRLSTRTRRAGRRSAVLGAVLLAASAATVLATANTAPHITSLTVTPNVSVINEGQSLTINGTFTDPDATDRHAILVYWNDTPNNIGNAEKLQLPPGQFTFQLNHTFRDDVAPTHFIVEVVDHQDPIGSNDNNIQAGQGEDTRHVPIQVLNVAPRFVAGSITLTKGPNRSVTVDGAFTDPGTLDTEQVTANWGDPYTPAPTTCTLTTDSRHFHCAHTYHAALVATTYRITLVARDDDGGTDTAPAVVTLP